MNLFQARQCHILEKSRPSLQRGRYRMVIYRLTRVKARSNRVRHRIPSASMIMFIAKRGAKAASVIESAKHRFANFAARRSSCAVFVEGF